MQQTQTKPITKPTEIHSYEQLINEPDKHYSLFYDYLCQGSERRINKLTQHAYSLHHIYHISVKHNWKQRLISYENTIGKQIRINKQSDYKTFLSKYEENALATFGEILGNTSSLLTQIGTIEFPTKMCPRYFDRSCTSLNPPAP